jgi:hypothetical protein
VRRSEEERVREKKLGRKKKIAQLCSLVKTSSKNWRKFPDYPVVETPSSKSMNRIGRTGGKKQAERDG